VTRAWPTHLASVRRHVFDHLDHLDGVDLAQLAHTLRQFATTT
jgi:hypothetical protein